MEARNWGEPQPSASLTPKSLTALHVAPPRGRPRPAPGPRAARGRRSASTGSPGYVRAPPHGLVAASEGCPALVNRWTRGPVGSRAGPGPWRGLDVRRGARDATALAVRALHSKPRRDGRARSRRKRAHLRRADESAELGLGVATMALDRRGMVANDLCRCAGPTHGLAGRAGARAAPRCPPRPSPRTRCSPPAPPAFACVASAVAKIVLGRAARGRACNIAS